MIDATLRAKVQEFVKENKENRNAYISSCIGLCNVSTLFVFVSIFIYKIFV